MSKASQYAGDPSIRIVTGVCPHDCPDTCSWQVAVNQTNGRAIDLWGHPDHPVTDGALCGKVDRYLERTYHPDRLTTPLRRIGAKGSGNFAPVSWQEALAEIAERLSAVIQRDGAEAVLPYSYAGTMGLLQGEGMAKRFFHRMGASQLMQTICSEAGFEGYVYTIGHTEGTETEGFAHARLILLWGTNTLTSNLHLWPFVQQARKNGARVIVIDPARTRTARAADEWIPIRPGADAALALAMMHVIVRDQLFDAAYVAEYCVGFDALAERVADWTPARAAALTGIAAERIEALATDYATTRPAAIRINYGLQRHAGGGMAVRTIACLPALVGAWRDVGGGIQLSTSGAFRHLDVSGLRRPDLLAGRRPRRINMNRLGDALSLDPATRARSLYHPRPAEPIPTAADAGAPVRALVVYNSNPAAVAPEQGAVIAGLRRSDLFTVVLEHFQTDTADYADFVLPATTQLEHWDILKAYGTHYLSLNQPAIEPVGQSLPNSEIFRRLAAAMGYDEACFGESDQQILRTLIEGQWHPRFASITWPRLLTEGFVRLDLPSPYLPFAQGGFGTPSGKCEFYSERMAADGYDPVPTYTPSRSALPEAPLTEPDLSVDDIPLDSLVCISPPAHSFLNSTFVNVPRFTAREGQPLLQIHPDDARPRGIDEGDVVRVWNEVGSVTLQATLTDGLIPGVVLAPGVWWSKFSADGRNINQVTPQHEADMGAGNVLYDVRVRVEHVDAQLSVSKEQGALPELAPV